MVTLDHLYSCSLGPGQTTKQQNITCFFSLSLTILYAYGHKNINVFETDMPLISTVMENYLGEISEISQGEVHNIHLYFFLSRIIKFS